jgi:hypothetical protein
VDFTDEQWTVLMRSCRTTAQGNVMVTRSPTMTT